MPSGSRKLCAYPGCAALVGSSERYCEQHRRSDVKRRTYDRTDTPWHRMYYTKAWRTLRKAHLIAEPFCRECRRAVGRIVPATDVDHIVPHRGNWSLFLDDSNLQSLCHTCHSRKTMAEVRGVGGGQKV